MTRTPIHSLIGPTAANPSGTNVNDIASSMELTRDKACTGIRVWVTLADSTSPRCIDNPEISMPPANTHSGAPRPMARKGATQPRPHSQAVASGRRAGIRNANMLPTKNPTVCDPTEIDQPIAPWKCSWANTGPST